MACSSASVCFACNVSAILVYLRECKDLVYADSLASYIRKSVMWPDYVSRLTVDTQDLLKLGQHWETFLDPKER